jgi:hypothetical protein
MKPPLTIGSDTVAIECLKCHTVARALLIQGRYRCIQLPAGWWTIVGYDALVVCCPTCVHELKNAATQKDDGGRKL